MTDRNSLMGEVANVVIMSEPPDFSVVARVRSTLLQWL